MKRWARCRRRDTGSPGNFSMMRLAVLSHVNAIAIDHASLWIFREHTGHALKNARFKQIVAVQPGPDLPVNMREPFIQGVTLPAILLAFPMAQKRFITADDLDALIGAAAIDHDQFEIGIILLKKRTQRRLEIRALIKRRSDDADFHAPISMGCRRRISSNQNK